MYTVNYKFVVNIFLLEIVGWEKNESILKKRIKWGGVIRRSGVCLKVHFLTKIDAPAILLVLWGLFSGFSFLLRCSF
jgi:hypothetical protein